MLCLSKRWSHVTSGMICCFANNTKCIYHSDMRFNLVMSVFPNHQIFQAFWRINASVEWVIVARVNGLSLIGCPAITWGNAVLSSLDQSTKNIEYVLRMPCAKFQPFFVGPRVWNLLLQKPKYSTRISSLPLCSCFPLVKYVENTKSICTRRRMFWWKRSHHVTF